MRDFAPLFAAVRYFTPLLAAVLFAPSTLLADTTPAGTNVRPITISHAARAEAPLKIDGRLDENDWASAAVTDSFTQIDPAEGKPATVRTEVRVLYDDDFLYVGARMYDTAPPQARLGRRDMDPGDSDWFAALIDSYHDHRTAFGFEVNPVGVRRDEIRTIDVDDNSWDPVWDVATSLDPLGWTAEIQIPFSQLRFSAANQQIWGVQFDRVIGRTQEHVVSTFIPKSERGGVPLYGNLEGLSGIRPGKRLEILPYTLEKSQFVDPGPNPFRKYPDHSVAAGLDLLYRVTSSLTLNAAFNPDFGQVEVDPAVVNLGVYETFFQEKRQFFIEGSEIFDFGASGTSGGRIFYSRRIGRAPTLGAPSIESDVPDATTILGAAKLSGKPGGWSVGVLEAVTDKEEARYRTSTLPDGRFAVEPLSNYLVGRTRREWRGGQSIIGGVLTGVNRNLSSPELRSALHSSAYAGGIDFRHEWGNRSWAVFGDGEVSRVQGSTSAIIATQRRSNHFFQRPDATHLEVDSSATSLNGYSVNLQLSKQSGAHWRGKLGTALTSPKYEVNDLGFSYRTDRRDFETDLTYLQNRPSKLLRYWNLTGQGRLERNYAWQSIQSFSSLTATAQTPAYWSLQSGAVKYYRAHDDRLTRGGPIATRPAHWFGFTFVSTDVRKPLTGSVTLSGDTYESDAWDWTASASLGIKTSSRWNLSLGPTFTRLYTPIQYVATVPNPANTQTYGADYVFAPLDQTQLGLETRLNVTFSPTLSLETYVQPLLSSADYGPAKQLVAPNTYDFAPYSGGVPNLDFNLRSLRGNAVLRWEWRQGSTLYFAWQQRRFGVAGVGDFSFDRDETALFRTRPDNIFLVKINYWFNP